MYIYERQLQHLRNRYMQWLPWIQKATGAQVSLVQYSDSQSFKVIARWSDQEHSKIYNHLAVTKKRGCTRDYARDFIKEVLEKRGII